MYGIEIHRGSPLSLTRQICDQLREEMGSGAIQAGTRLLSTRLLAREWGVARNVVIEVYEQLAAEGYLESRTGSGTYVAEGIQRAAGGETEYDGRADAAPSGSAAADRNGMDGIDFATGLPDSGLFPRALWGKALRTAAEAVPEANYGYGDIAGEAGLRAVLSDYLFRSRGIRCTTDQLIIVSGASEGLSLIAKALASRYHSLYVEDPTIGFTRDIFRMAGYDLVPAAVDANGMMLEVTAPWPPGHLALLTPSHQYPTGSILSIQRRRLAISLAEEAGSYVLEDDYDSEFRLKGIPVAPMQTLAPSRVIYIGTFSKTLSPSLRIGFLIAPPQLVPDLIQANENLNLFTPPVNQQALRLFISEGHLERHIYAMKKVYRQRRALLKRKLLEAFGDEISLPGDETGMHLLVRFRSDRLAQLPWEQAELYGFRAELTDEGGGNRRSGIVLGYGNLPEAGICEGIRRMAAFADAASAGMCKD